MPHWDYSGNGIYFITFVTQHRDYILGNIRDGKMILSDFGKIVDEEWHKSFQIRKELFLDEYIIMPNHLHAIVVLNIDTNGLNVDTNGRSYPIDNDNAFISNNGIIGNNVSVPVETHGRASLQPPPQQSQQQDKTNNEKIYNQPQITRNIPIRKPKSLSSFVAGFKSAVNSKIDDWIDLYGFPDIFDTHDRSYQKYNKQNSFFQPNYHDHIIRNPQEYNRIKNYIINNPIQWENDTLQLT
jgi:REP element-mobilizing transposase RayT